MLQMKTTHLFSNSIKTCLTKISMVKIALKHLLKFSFLHRDRRNNLYYRQKCIFFGEMFTNKIWKIHVFDLLGGNLEPKGQIRLSQCEIIFELKYPIFLSFDYSVNVIVGQHWAIFDICCLTPPPPFKQSFFPDMEIDTINDRLWLERYCNRKSLLIK